MKTGSMLRTLALCVTVAAALAGAPHAAAQAKKQVKISHATAADVANDNHMTAWIIANYINSNSDTLEARVYPANQLGEERAVIEGMQLGAGATMHIGGTAIHNNFNKRMGVLDLPFMWKNYEHAHHVLDGKVGADAGGGAREARPQGAGLAGQLGLPQRRHHQEGSEEAGGSEGPQDPHDPDADLRRRAERDGRVGHADGVRRGLHVAADRRARRLRAFVRGRSTPASTTRSRSTSR